MNQPKLWPDPYIWTPTDLLERGSRIHGRRLRIQGIAWCRRVRGEMFGTFMTPERDDIGSFTVPSDQFFGKFRPDDNPRIRWIEIDATVKAVGTEAGRPFLTDVSVVHVWHSDRAPSLSEPEPPKSGNK